MPNSKQAEYLRGYLRITPDIKRLNAAIDVFARRTSVDKDETTQHLTKMRDGLLTEQKSHPLQAFLDLHVSDSK